MKNNLHLFISDITVETRLFKECSYCYQNGISNNFVLGRCFVKDIKAYDDSKKELIIFRQLFLRTERILLKKLKIFNIFFLILNMVMYTKKAMKLINSKKVDNLIIHNCALLPVASFLLFFHKIKLIYQPHELESKKSGLPSFFQYLYYCLEYFSLNKNTVLISVCQPISDWYKKNFKLNNVYTIRNLPDQIQIKSYNKNKNIKKLFSIENKELLYIYQGLISDNRGCNFLIDTFKNKNKKLVFMGHMDKSVDKANYHNIYYLPPVPKNDIISYSSSADIGVHINNDDSLSYQFSLPNKFYEYIHAGIPIIVSSNMEYLSSIVKDNDLGWVIDFNDFPNLVDKIDKNIVECKKSNLQRYADDCIYELDAKVLRGIYEF